MIWHLPFQPSVVQELRQANSSVKVCDGFILLFSPFQLTNFFFNFDSRFILTYASDTWILTKRGRKQINVFERKVCRRILGPVYDNEKENWRILTNKEIYAMVNKPIIIETISLNRLSWFGHVQRMEENKIPKNVLYMNLEATRLRGKPRNRWQVEVREDGRLVGGRGRKERVYNRKEWKKLLRTAKNRRILHMPMEWMN